MILIERISLLIVGDYNGIPVYLYPGSGNSLYATVNHTFEGYTTLDDQNRYRLHL